MSLLDNYLDLVHNSFSVQEEAEEMLRRYQELMDEDDSCSVAERDEILRILHGHLGEFNIETLNRNIAAYSGVDMSHQDLYELGLEIGEKETVSVDDKLSLVLLHIQLSNDAAAFNQNLEAGMALE